jgi:NADPH:quinone reductase-like Zn-dependent oxidoreductase
MKAAVHRRFGSPDVVTVDDVPEPVPRDDEVLVQIHAATVGVVDIVARRGTPFYARFHFGLSRPVIDACYPLRRIADAHRHVDSGHKKGNIIVTMVDPREPAP